jgi:hypothetical protein
LKKLPWKLVLLILLVGINGILLIFQFWPEGTRPQGMMRFVWVFLLAACYGLILFLLHRLHDRYGKYFPAVTGQGTAVLSFSGPLPVAGRDSFVDTADGVSDSRVIYWDVQLLSGGTADFRRSDWIQPAQSFR